jgi:molecular chaperone GrpE
LSKEQEEKRPAHAAPGSGAANAGHDADDGAATERRDDGAEEGSGGDAQPRTLDQARDRIDLLREQLATKTEELLQARDASLRERAEVENFKRRIQREKAEALRYATEPLLRDLLPIVDNLERAVQAAGSGEEASRASQVDALVTGVRLVLQQFSEVLERHGVSRVGAVGHAFDPSQHEAVAHVESDQHAPGGIVDEYASGYRLHERLLRPAQVTVAKGRRSQ